MRYLISFFIFSIYLFGFNYHLKPYKISDGIHCFFGLPSQVSHVNGGNMINSCYIETTDAYIVIDSGPTYLYAQEAYEIMKKIKQLPVKYVINTSWDEVHVLGNQFYKELGAELLGPKGYKEHLESKDTLSLKAKLSKDAFANTRAVALDKYIKREKVLKFEKMNVNIKILEGDSSHLYVYIAEKNIVFAGDLIFNNRIPVLNNGRSLVRWLVELDKLSSLKWSDIISSHGYMTRRSALKNTKSYLSLLKSQIIQELKNGNSRRKILENVKLSSFSEDKFYKTRHHRNVVQAYDELKVLIEESTKTGSTNELSLKIAEELKKIEVSKIIEPKSNFFPTQHDNVKYKKFSQAINIAKRKNKIVLIKVRSTICKYCDQLDGIIERNSKVKKILNKYFELVKINTDDEDIPMNLIVRSTPTLIFIRPNDKKVLMQLSGIRALGELLEVLNEAVDDGHNAGYLIP
jgi:glyoxylase-like metal-dependent hydrolase (beta-lactamase superfamily II)/thioredoxin-related protein